MLANVAKQSTPSAEHASSTAEHVLQIENIEVIYDHVILVLKGVSLAVPSGGIVALLGANGAGKSTTLKAASSLLSSERGEVTRGSVRVNGINTKGLTPGQLVKMGCIQVIEGRRCFGHLTVEENLLSGAFTRWGDSRSVKEDLDQVYTYFPKLRERRRAQAGYTSGGEQQMCAIGRALMARPRLVLLDEPSMGLAPRVVDEIFQIVRNLNEQTGVSFLVAEQNASIALRYAHYGYILDSGRVVLDGKADDLRNNEDVREFYLGISGGGRQSFKESKHYRRRKRWLM